jgi:hypothetical protein
MLMRMHQNNLSRQGLIRKDEKKRLKKGVFSNAKHPYLYPKALETQPPKLQFQG